jgi:hypothetical protein
MARHQQDALSVQVAIHIKHPDKNFRPSRRMLSQIIERLVNHQPLPRVVEVRGIFWRNPDRRGRLSEWRYHEGADLSAFRDDGNGIEGTPRGNLRSAVDTLAGLLEVGMFTF